MLLAAYPSLNYVAGNTPTFSSPGVALTAAGSAHTKGSWASIISSISYDVVWMQVAFSNMFTTTVVEFGLADLGIGPDSSNVSVIAENLICGMADAPLTPPGGRVYWLPLRVPAGTQLWGRCQGTTASDTVRASVQLWGGEDLSGFPAGSYVAAIGANTATSGGVSFTPGNGSWGSFVEMDPSSDDDYIAFTAAHEANDGTLGGAMHHLGIGLGASSGGEHNLGIVAKAQHTNSEAIRGESWPIFCKAPAGTRVALRAMSQTTPDSNYTGIVYGVRP